MVIMPHLFVGGAGNDIGKMHGRRVPTWAIANIAKDILEDLDDSGFIAMYFTTSEKCDR